MRRGEIWTIAEAADYTGKPRPAVVVQDDSFDSTESVTVSPLTSITTDASLFRIAITPNERNGLKAQSRLMVDKITTVRKSRVGIRIGRLDDEDILRLNSAMLVFLGLTVSPRARLS